MSNLLLSFELLYLIDWLLKNEKKSLHKLIKQAVDNGFAIELNKITSPPTSQTSEALQNTFLDFITHIEDALLDSLDNIEKREDIEHGLMSAFNNLNINNIPSTIILSSLRQAEMELRKQNITNKQASQKVLLKKILKNWEPTEQDIN